MTAGCAEHGEVGEELRLLALALLDRFEPGVRSVLAGLRVEAESAAAAGSPNGQPAAACQWCPVCSVIALVRGDRPELGGRIAEQVGALLTTLRAVLEQPPSNAQPADAQPAAAARSADAESAGAAAAGAAAARSADAARPRVQRIQVLPADDGC